MIKKTLYFTECEHHGDLDNYISDLRDSGAIIIASTVFPDTEVGEVTIEVKDITTFIKKFKKTESYEFIITDL